MDEALGAGVAGVGLAVSTGSLWLTAAPLISNIARLAGAAPVGPLYTHREMSCYITDKGQLSG